MSQVATTSATRLDRAVPLKVVKPRVQQKKPGLGMQLLTAGSAACVADMWTFPLDTAKVRLQVRALLMRIGASANYNSFY